MKRVRELATDTRAQMAMIMSLVSGAITVILAIIIFANVAHNMPAVNDTMANATIASVSNIFYSSVNLLVIGFLVLAAVFILSVVQSLRVG